MTVNFGSDLTAAAFPEPLIAPPEGQTWSMRWSSESLAYGGFGAYDVVTDAGWRVPGRSAAVLAPMERRDGRA